ncbi:phosphatidylinositol-specific phospholipase C [Kibdelosporangium phytohabitans]|uniref:1-phosphatidylinositol phosphodiesterase n=1 Tax=Kibdelosporangium phytohabitans TaxID=860235 RepID=A0A0N9I6I7_9PSEU|nr:phosphatidylinositol-specific phospholipase C [Kibdelosporangium phytohabitans]ALG10210.1 hypothetical protein AOZ06_27935 [Kibdelosporangium phytohabitans]MBE1461230.1 1-phosphatidylinositol phosphodiesterase [Kibdelosporangium phytohabitans]
MSTIHHPIRRTHTFQNTVRKHQHLGLEDPRIQAMIRDSGVRGSRLVHSGPDVEWDTTNWLGSLRDDVSAGLLSVPGSHESCARYGGAWVACQTLDIASQLNYGARFLDIRCRVVGPDDDRSFAIHHGAFYQHLMFGDVLRQCAEFLEDNPSETIFMRVKQEYSDVSDAAFKKVFDDRYLSDLFYTDSWVPDLGDVRGRIVLFGNVAGLGGIAYGGSNFVIQDDYTVTNIDDKIDEICDQANKSITRTDDDRVYINYVSGTDAPWLSPQEIAYALQGPVQSALEATLVDPPDDLGPLGIMPLDYFQSFGWWDVDLVFDIIMWNTSILA